MTGAPASDDAKRRAAEAGAALAENGMRLGLGTGSTMVFVLDALAARIAAETLSIVGVPTSERTADQARRLGIPLTTLAETPELDLALDGADEVLPGPLDLIKGLGGALLREKIVVEAAHRFVVIADESKIVSHLGQHAPLPVEVATFAHEATALRLGKLGLKPVLRLAAGRPYLTDNGNVIYDCPGIAGIADAAAIEQAIAAIAGVIDTGLFLKRAQQAIIGTTGGVEVLRRTA